MARIPKVTRTITTTIATVMCLDIQNAEPCNKQVKLPRTYKNEHEMLKQAKETIETDNLKVVHIVDFYTEETLYGMSEQKFIENAEILPPRDANNED